MVVIMYHRQLLRRYVRYVHRYYIPLQQDRNMPVNATEIMNLGKQLLDQYPEAFTEDFETNKRKVEQLTDIRTHHTVNRIAGHITRQKERTD